MECVLNAKNIQNLLRIEFHAILKSVETEKNFLKLVNVRNAQITWFLMRMVNNVLINAYHWHNLLVLMANAKTVPNIRRQVMIRFRAMSLHVSGERKFLLMVNVLSVLTMKFKGPTIHNVNFKNVQIQQDKYLRYMDHAVIVHHIQSQTQRVEHVWLRNAA